MGYLTSEDTDQPAYCSVFQCYFMKTWDLQEPHSVTKGSVKTLQVLWLIYAFPVRIL